MGEWKKSGCVLCAQNCGLELFIENNRIEKVKGDKDNPRSRGYVCRKGMNVSYHQHHDQRLTHPLKKKGDAFVKISWDEAIGEIADKLKAITGAHGPRSFAYMGGGGQGCHFEAAFGTSLMKGLGSRYHYNAVGQEFSGLFWVFGRVTGKQYNFLMPDESRSDMLVATGWNGMVSHQIPRAPLVLREFSKDPARILLVIDPRKSETAEIADIHLALRPGTDALLTKAMIAIILRNGWEKREYIEKYVSGFDQVRAHFTDFDAKSAVAFCELDYDKVVEVCGLFTTRNWSMHPDLGIYMNRHSTLASYLHNVLMAVCGRLAVPGGNIIPGTLMPLGGHSDERDEKTWRTVETNFPPVLGYYPPNAMPEEILSDKPDRLRAVCVSGANPLRSFADTTAYERAFARLDLLVTSELAMTETAALSHYVLPARSGYESWDGTFFPLTFPEIYFQMRRPLVEPDGEQLEVGEIYTRIADAMGLIPAIPDSLHEAAKGPRAAFGAELMKFAMSEPRALKGMPFILAKTLGKTLGSGNLAALWGMLMTAPKLLRENAVRAGFKDSPLMGEEIFQAVLDHPEGLWIGKCDPDDNMSLVTTEDKKLNVYAPEMQDWLRDLDTASEKRAMEPGAEFPLILNAGRHMSMNANTLMRNPEWNSGKRACTLAMHPDDAAERGLADGEKVRVRTQAGQVDVELEVTEAARRGQVIIPHGFGLDYNGNVYGVNVNRLTKNTHRDHFLGTPLHRYVPCRVEKL
ncbi:MAG: molybdopterin dinucleotide-binding protein [Spirochaetes bacterium]|nr:MAG: molybdopterin dinucleotide-binding protein [Spirochaetota bacterium]